MGEFPRRSKRGVSQPSEPKGLEKPGPCLLSWRDKTSRKKKDRKKAITLKKKKATPSIPFAEKIAIHPAEGGTLSDTGEWGERGNIS